MSGSRPVLRVEDLRVHFPGSRRDEVVRAVEGVSFELGHGETLGLVGESGCGKSTTARAILGLVPAKSGRAWLDLSAAGKPAREVDLLDLRPGALKDCRQHIQMIFQDPYASLNPRMTVGHIIEEPLKIFRRGGRMDRVRQVRSLMEEVGLDPTFIRRYPHEFSGGQRQRIGIARALALNPRVIICDEPVSALDVSIRSQVLNLLRELQEKRGLSYIFIAHDLGVVKSISHRVAVMYLGRIVELAPSEEIYRNPLHPYTRALLSAIPIPDPDIEKKRERIVLRGDLPGPTAPRVGCDFAGRCPEVIEGRCQGEIPALLEQTGSHEVACFLHEPETGAVRSSSAGPS